MPSIDMPLEQMRQYKPSLYREADFEQILGSTIAEALKQPLNAELIPYDLPAAGCSATPSASTASRADASRAGTCRPNSAGKFPGVCMYHGYSGRGPRLLDMLDRGAGHVRAEHGLPRPERPVAGRRRRLRRARAGWMTQGIRDPRQYYYRYVYADAVRAPGTARATRRGGRHASGDHRRQPGRRR